MHYYQHHIGDFIRDTSKLEDHQCMTYLRLLWIYYESEKPLPDDVEVLAMQTGSDPQTVSLILRAYFTQSERIWIHMRCESEIIKYQKKSSSAKAANAARWSDSHLKSEKKSEKKSYPNQEPITNNQEPLKEKPIAHPSDDAEEPKIYTPQFLAFWELYPKKKSKGDAAKAFSKIKAAEYPAIRQGLEAAIKSAQWLKDNGEFIPYPATWLRDRGWEDENEIKSAQPAKYDHAAFMRAHS